MKLASHLPGVILARISTSSEMAASTELEHLDACSRCRSVVEEMRALRDLLRESVEEPGIEAVARVHALFPECPPSRREMSGFPLAELVHDSAAALAFAGSRAAFGTSRQVWRTHVADLDLRLEKSSSGRRGTIAGQVLPRQRGKVSPLFGTARLVESGEKPLSAAVDASGEFILPAPRGSRWTLCVEWNDLRLRVSSPTRRRPRTPFRRSRSS